MKKRQAGEISAMEEASRYLGPRMRSEAEVRKHLKERAFDPSDIDEAVESLSALGYIDDAGYAESYAAYAYEKNRGRNRILRELRERGIAAEIAENAIEDYCYEHGIDERTIALRAAGKTAAGGALDQKALGRTARRLEQLGFDYSVICSVLEELRKTEHEDIRDCGSASFLP